VCSENLLKQKKYIMCSENLLKQKKYIVCSENLLKQKKYTGKVTSVIIRVFIHSSFCVLNVILSACRPNFAEAARTI
jgi:hypothetical protein